MLDDEGGDDDQAQHFMFLSFVFNVLLPTLKYVFIVFGNHVDCKLFKVSKLYNTCFLQR